MNRESKGKKGVTGVSKIWWLVGGLVGLGMMITIYDYWQWKHAETDRYGQGWEDMDKPALPLSEMYNNPEAGVRLHVPAGWKVAGEGQKPAPEGVEVTTKLTDGNLTDLADARVEGLKKAGTPLSGERQYIITEKADLTVITYENNMPGGGADMIQEAWAKKGNRLVVIKAEAPEQRWGELRKTYFEIYKSLEML